MPMLCFGTLNPCQRFLPRPRDPVKDECKRPTKMCQELLVLVEDQRHQVSELKDMTVNRIPFESPSPRTPERIPEFEHSTPATSEDWESIYQNCLPPLQLRHPSANHHNVLIKTGCKKKRSQKHYESLMAPRKSVLKNCTN